MFPTSKSPIGLDFERTDSCYDQKDLHNFGPWMNTAPFEVDLTQNKVKIDLSNSIPTKSDNSPRDIGTLHLGVLVDSKPCVLLLSEETGIPYTTSNSGGIFTINVDASQKEKLSNSVLVVARLSDGGDGDEICGESLIAGRGKHTVQVLLQESAYFVRPKGYYSDRLEKEDVSKQELYVTKYGAPVKGVEVQMFPGNSVYPPNGIQPQTWRATTNSDGIATFEFAVTADIPAGRKYDNAKCLDEESKPRNILPIDGQVYTFTFCASVECEDQGITLSFLAFSDVGSQLTPTWQDVEPILSQHVGMIPMGTGTFESLTEPKNLQLFKSSLDLQFHDPHHVPATRDLSPKKRKMLATWADNPVPIKNRCDPSGLSFLFLMIPARPIPICTALLITCQKVLFILTGWYQLLH